MFLYLSLLITCILAGIEIDIFTPSFPEIGRHFQLSPFMLQLMLSVNFAAYCVGSLFVGSLGDRYGRRPVILISFIIFIVGSFLCTFAPTYEWLILGRLLQGLGISGPAVLAYVVIIDAYPPEKQASMMGILNGIITLSMALAPVFGSYVNLYYGWRGNFSILLGHSILAFGLCLWTLPKGVKNPNASLSLAGYSELLKSRTVLTYIWALCFSVVGYWVFIGISPLLYMDSLGVDLKHFGFYQGALSAAYAVISLTSPLLFKRFGLTRSLKGGTILQLSGSLALMMAGVFLTDNPLIITGLMIVISLGVVFPFNILFPAALEAVPDSKGKMAALMNAIRLIICAIALEFIGYIYTGAFYPIALFIGVSATSAFLLIRQLPDWRKSEAIPKMNEKVEIL
ncbi:MAG: multidrug effflux MFS transporter [Alphaproteobacteria bacterium]|nr:multidrug effflux MFS transporter [Alphaproteobacteria bacterium]